MIKVGKYFVSPGQIDFMVVYEDWCDNAGYHWATKQGGFETQEEAQAYADKLNLLER